MEDAVGLFRAALEEDDGGDQALEVCDQVGEALWSGLSRSSSGWRDDWVTTLRMPEGPPTFR